MDKPHLETQDGIAWKLISPEHYHQLRDAIRTGEPVSVPLLDMRESVATVRVISEFPDGTFDVRIVSMTRILLPIEDPAGTDPFLQAVDRKPIVEVELTGYWVKHE